MELPPVFQREFVIAVRRAQLAAERHARRFFSVLGVLFLLIGCFYADFIRQFPRMLWVFLGILPFFTFALLAAAIAMYKESKSRKGAE